MYPDTAHADALHCTVARSCARGRGYVVLLAVIIDRTLLSR